MEEGEGEGRGHVIAKRRDERMEAGREGTNGWVEATLRNR